ncbi:MAG TPA: DUF1501 domain-containing protein [Puia sp.]|nr:DUF1501 domain-containing protein [Puia sp.]
MIIKRRTFLQWGTLASSSFLIPQFLKAFEGRTGLSTGNKALVILQLSGGNDGLNTVIPVSNDIYYRERPMLGIAKDKALRLSDDAGIHPELSFLKSLYDDGYMAILNNVGYPNPDRSHFRSMDIWQSAAQSNEFLNSGWLGRWLDEQCVACDKPTQALEMDDTLSLALTGEQLKGIALQDPARLYNTSRDPYFTELLKAQASRAAHNENAAYLYQVMAETVSSASYIYEQSRLRPGSQVYPKTGIGRNLKTIASLICSDINTRVYYLSLGSFDTHVNQQDRQQKLFSEMNEAVSSFVTDLKANHRFDDVLLLTFSEFGRRVSQNAGGGTDHGTANNMFLIGGGLKKKGLLNGMPDLGNLADGDLQFQLDFKSVYATVLNKWLQADDRKILGRQYDLLDFI